MSKVDNAVIAIDELSKDDPSNPEYQKLKKDLVNMKENVLNDLENARLSVPTQEARRSWAAGGARGSTYSARRSVGARASIPMRPQASTPDGVCVCVCVHGCVCGWVWLGGCVSVSLW